MSEQEDYLMSLILASNHNEPNVRSSAIDEIGQLIPSLGSPQLREAAHNAIAARLEKQIDLAPCQLKESKVLGAPASHLNVKTLAKQILIKLHTREALAILYPSRIQSKLYWPNAWARHYFTGYANPAVPGGHSSLVAMLQMFQGVHLGWSHFPADNLQREIDFVDIGGFNQGLLKMYGLKAGLSVQGTLGKRWFASFLPELSFILSSQKAESSREKVLQALQALAQIFSSQSDQLSHVEKADSAFLFLVRQCPHCWGVERDTVFCYPMTAFLTSLVAEISQKLSFTVIETDCCAKGDKSCVFRIELLGEEWDINT